MDNKKILLFEPFDTEFGGHFFETNATYLKFLLETGNKPVFVLGGRRTKNLEDFLIKMGVIYYKLKPPVYKSRSRLPGPIKLIINLFSETVRYTQVLKLGQKEKVDLINLMTFGVYEPLQLFLAVLYNNCKIPIVPFMHMITTEEKDSLNPKTFFNKLIWSFSFIFLRRLINRGNIKKIILYTDIAKDFFLRNVTKQIIKIDHPVYLDYEKFNYTQRDSSNLLKLPTDSPLFVIFNPDAKGKSIDALFDGLPLVENKYKIVLAGYFSQPFREKVEKLISAHNLADKVILVDKFLGTEERFHYLNAADIVLLPYEATYKRNKATSHILAECIVLRKPVIITSGVAEGDEIVRKHELGLVTNDYPRDWSKNLDYFLQNSNTIKELAWKNSAEIRHRWDYKTELKKVYDTNNLFS